MPAFRRFWATGPVALALIACGGPETGTIDAGVDVGVDAPAVDAFVEPDAVPDAPGELDAGTDAGDDAESDAGSGTCGDGVLDPGEECDDGIANSDEVPDACRTRCVRAGCGDAVRDSAEECDGADLGGVRCVDRGFAGGTLACADDCTFDASRCERERCGNGVAEGAERCDRTDLRGRTCSDVLGPGAIGTLSCRADCTFEIGACTYCGNGSINPGEACDGTSLGGRTCESEGFDGGEIACAADCTLDTGACTRCGDGSVADTEECDGSDLRGQSCGSRGFAGGTLACGADCRFDTSRCFRCGDGRVDPGEECDGSALGGATCTSRGFDGGSLACTGACTFDTAGCTRCGDDVREGAEVCDGIDLAEQDCTSRGFEGGTLACARGCASFDTSGCFRCGDGVINGREACDGSALGGQTCVSRGFDGGTLRCSASCTYDTSGCHLCGDGRISGPEQCDGSALGGESCVSRGYTEGTLACTSGCLYDESACTLCGDDVAEGTEACDGTDLRGETCATRPGFASGTLACSGTCTFDTSLCTTAPRPTMPGQIVITEVMRAPSALGDAEGEWFEVRNTTAGTLNLHACTVSGSGGAADAFTITTNVTIAAGAYATFARNTGVSGPPGFDPSFRWTGGFTLDRTPDAITIRCGGVEIDTVAWSASFPDPVGRSMTLSPAALDATSNDSGANWCISTLAYASGDRGTPGAANEDCITFPIGFCRLQFPTAIAAATPASETMAYGRVYIAGLTDRTGINDPDPHVLAQVGVGPDGSDPATSSAWIWRDANPNAAYAPGSPSYEPNNDEYEALLIAPIPGGPYDFAFRFSGDVGRTWVVCDGGSAGSSDGYAPADAGQMRVLNLYFSEYVEGSGTGNKAVEIYNSGSTALNLMAEGCSVRISFNGGTSVSTINLTGTVAAGGVYTLCHTSINTGHPNWPSGYVCNQLSSSVTFNGDDAVYLVCSGTGNLDVIGQIGFRPDPEWGTGLTSTADNTIRRLCTVPYGDRNGTDPFDPSIEWAGFPQDTFSGLGTRGCP